MWMYKLFYPTLQGACGNLHVASQDIMQVDAPEQKEATMNHGRVADTHTEIDR